jgi:hypothetical protein
VAAETENKRQKIRDEAVDSYPEGVDSYPEGVDLCPEGVDSYPEGVDSCVGLELTCADTTATSWPQLGS